MMNMNKFKKNILLLLIISVCHTGYANNKLVWHELPEIPAEPESAVQVGLAGAFTGVSNQAIIVAGGANFSDKPLIDGGKKVYHQAIFVMTKNNSEFPSKKNCRWQYVANLPEPIAYGVSLTTDKGIICIGGELQNGSLSKKVYLLRWNTQKRKLKFIRLPDLPDGFAHGAGANINNRLFIICGLFGNKPSNNLLMLDINKIDEDSSDSSTISSLRWIKCSPYPSKPRLDMVAASQHGSPFGKLFMFSGHTAVAGNNGNKQVALISGFSYNPDNDLILKLNLLKCAKEKNKDAIAHLQAKIENSRNKHFGWHKIADIIPKGCSEGISLLGASAIATGTHHILFFGGYNKKIWDSWFEKLDSIGGNKVKLQAAQKAFFSQTPKAFKWNKKILAYHTVTDTWAIIDEFPYAPTCGAGIVQWQNGIVLINGEIKPGVRTPKVYYGTFENQASFGVLNWFVLIIYMLGMIAIGYIFMLREHGTNDFFKGGGRVPWWAAGVSIFATMLSSISFMAIPGMTYAGTWAIFILALTITMSQPIVIRYYLPFFRRLNVTTAYEYLEVRFNLLCRTIASMTFILFMIVRIGIVSYLPAIALEAITGIDIVTCIFGIGLITIVYCTMGGVEAVIWGDFIQGIILISGALIAFLYIASGVPGGIAGIIHVGISHDKFQIINTALDLTKPTIWILLIGGILSNLFSYTSDQSIIQRYITTKDEKTAAKSIWLNAWACIPVSILFYLIGTGLYAFYMNKPDMLDVNMNKSDQIFPFFIMQNLPVGLTGLLIAAVFSATMSTLSSNINSAATAFTTDFYKRFRKNTTDKQCMTVARVSTVMIGIAGILIAYALYLMKDIPIFEYFGMIVGLLVSGLGVLFMMGIFSTRITGWSAITGFLASCIVLYFVKNYTPLFWAGYSIVALISCGIIAYLTSFIFNDRKNIEGLTIYTLKNK